MLHAEIKSLPSEDISILINVENSTRKYLCDCGEASLLSVKEAQNLSAIFISHTHIDHFSNFDGLFRHQIGSGETIIICGPKNIQNHVASRLQSYTWNLVDDSAICYEIREIVSPEEINVYEVRPPFWEISAPKRREGSLYTDESIEVTFTILDHKTPSIAYLFKANDKINFNEEKIEFPKGKWMSELRNAFIQNNEEIEIIVDNTPYIAKELFHLLKRTAGFRLGIIMDHATISENREKIKTTFKNVDLVYIEAFYKDDEKDFAETNFHSYASASGAVMKESQVVDAIPIHFSRRYSQEDILEIQECFDKAFGKDRNEKIVQKDE